MFNRIWTFGWVNSRGYVKSRWTFHFNYYKNCIWQLMIVGFFITSTNVKSVYSKKKTNVN